MSADMSPYSSAHDEPANTRTREKALKSSHDEWLIMKLCMDDVCICGMERYIINYTS